ncbi:ran-binding protein 3 [Pectinophora gossypiella]|uniref:ran-binding protein 3 n=1 Tax=Pectinophora gossypiella TaxID=13191 RepID=UPI00214EF177|nr:ran-binding protein 3 [Pectinophora gossypiella]
MADAKQGKTPIEDFYNGSSQSRVVLAKPRLGGFGSSSFASSSSSKSCNPFGSVLRPSTLKPGSNPFLKITDTEEEKEKVESKQEEDNVDRLKDSQEEEEAPKFVPLGSANVTPRTSNPVPAPAQPTTASSSSGFVFGQNLSERVVIQENVNNGDIAPVDHSSTNGTTDLLFTSAAASVKDNQEEAGPSSPGPGGAGAAGGAGAGLAAAAAAYERSHARPPPPPATAGCNITGEEGEINVLQISCRLFAWEAGSWRERGRGVLRLNDAMAGGGAARLVARVAGSLRVVLNTKLWPDMVVQRAGTKSLRITAADAQQQVKLFLIMGAPADIVQLYRALSARVAMSKKSSNCTVNSNSQQAAERLEAAAEDDEFEDKADHASDKTQPSDNDRINNKTEESPTNNDTKPLKRKEPVEEETSPKRQCPEILTE